MSVAGRFIYSDLKVAVDADTSSASSFGIDISAFYQSQIFKLKSNSALVRSGINISNIGPRLNYESGAQKSFIPTTNHWMSAPARDADVGIYIKYMNHLCVHDYSSGHRHFDKTFEKLYKFD